MKRSLGKFGSSPKISSGKYRYDIEIHLLCIRSEGLEQVNLLDFYLSLNLFNQRPRSSSYSGQLPLKLTEVFPFTKIFSDVRDVDYLEGLLVKELFQIDVRHSYSGEIIAARSSHAWKLLADSLCGRKININFRLRPSANYRSLGPLTVESLILVSFKKLCRNPPAPPPSPSKFPLAEPFEGYGPQVKAKGSENRCLGGTEDMKLSKATRTRSMTSKDLSLIIDSCDRIKHILKCLSRCSSESGLKQDLIQLARKRGESVEGLVKQILKEFGARTLSSILADYLLEVGMPSKLRNHSKKNSCSKSSKVTPLMNGEGDSRSEQDFNLSKMMAEKLRVGHEKNADRWGAGLATPERWALNPADSRYRVTKCAPRESRNRLGKSAFPKKVKFAKDETPVAKVRSAHHTSFFREAAGGQARRHRIIRRREMELARPGSSSSSSSSRPSINIAKKENSRLAKDDDNSQKYRMLSRKCLSSCEGSKDELLPKLKRGH